MSTSPSWFDQDKFSRLVKKVGTKTVPVSPSRPATPTQPLPETPQPAASQPIPEVKPAPAPEARSSQPLPEPPPSQPLPEPAASQRLPEVAKQEPEPQESEFIEEKAPSLPVPAPAQSQSLPPPPGTALSASQRLMTSQSISFPKLRAEPTPEPAPRLDEPIRAPAQPAYPAVESKALPAETNAPPSILRRTSSLPALKDVFRYEIPAVEEKHASPEALPDGWEPLPPSVRNDEHQENFGYVGHAPEPESSTSSALAQTTEDLAAAWEKIAQLNEEVAVIARERDHALNEGVNLREELTLVTRERDQAYGEIGQLQEQLDQANEKVNGLNQDSAQVEELHQQVEQITRERDEALADGNALRDELRQAYESAKNQDALAGQMEELTHAKEERDRIRRDYMELREQFETLKQDKLHAKGEVDRGRADLEKQNEALRLKIAEMELELGSSSSAPANDDVVESLKKELSKTKDEASIAQRGLALSQKALQETREALREASQAGTPALKATMDNLKKENSTLVQQNMLLQAQNDQVARELSAAKARLQGR